MVLLLAVFSCKNNQDNEKSLLYFVPNQATTIIKTKNLSSFYSNTNSNQITGHFDILKVIKPLNIEQDAIIALKKDTINNIEVLVITPFTEHPFKIDSTINHSSEIFKSNNKNITKTTIGEQVFYSTLTDSTLLIANKPSLLNTPNKRSETNLERKTLLSTSNENSTFSIYLSPEVNDMFSKLFQTQKFTSHTVLDGDISQNSIILNGITKANDSSKSFINIFKNTIPQKNRTSVYAPNDTQSFLSATFNSFLNIAKNIQKTTNDSTETQIPSILETTIEMGQIHHEQGHATLLYTLDGNTAFETLENFEIEEKFREVAIYKLNTPDLFNSVLPIFKTDSLNHFIQIEDAFLFAKNTAILKTIISHYQNNSTLANTDAFVSMMENLNDESSLFLYNSNKGFEQSLQTLFENKQNLSSKGHEASGIQFIYDTDFAHVNAVVKKHKKKPKSNSISEELNITLESPILNNPQLFFNHTNNQKDIVIQDIENNLYLISNTGKIHWKKQLDGKILGNIEQMDIYKNGRYQLVFATPHRVYVLDRNGNDVGPFPLKFKDEITQPLSLFDYDKNKNYRLLITQGQTLLMYDKNGKRINGFTYDKAPKPIITQPKHIRIGKKDHIVFIQGKTLEILDRTGKTRVNIKDEFDFSGNDIYLYNNTFATTTEKGIFVQFDQKGKLSSADLRLKEDHQFCSTSKTLVTLSENKLGIKSKEVELDFGEYTAPKIFYINNKIYVSTTDLQSNKVFLFDSQAKPISNFPIYGNSEMVLDNIDKDPNLEVVVKGSKNSIIVYQIN